ncbi:MAG: LamG domain-containing protein, partial [Candidatus Marsarchaeota archaeon]|nr:LamG domain-containing protein [Candidatus Marsarchaeota archaeon]
YQLALTQAGGVGGSPAINTPGLYFSIGSSNVYIPNYDLADNGWHNIVASWGGGNTVYLGIDGNLPEGYIWNGISWGSLSSQPFALPSVPSPADSAILIGGGRCQLWNTGSAFFNGMISDVQLYSSGLEANQLLSEYLGGVQGLPTATQNAIAWWPLNGNSNDYSGGDNTAIAGNVAYALLQNYSRSSIFNTAVNGTGSAAVPGVLSCSNSSQCSDANLPHLYLGTAYMRNGGPVLLPYFNGEAAYEETGATPNTVQYKLTSGSVFEWVNTTSNNAVFTAMQNQSSLVYLEVGASTDGGNNNQLVVYLESSSGYSVMPWNSGVVINDNAWRQIGVTWNGLAATMYINGNAVASNDFTGAVNLEANMIDFGALPPFTPNADYEMAGSLADVQVYNQSLSGNQVYALYKEGLLGMPLPGANVVGWWPMLGNGNDYSGLGVNAAASQYLFYRYLNSSVQLPGMQTIKAASTAGQTFGFG